jgi:WD40 repeat protein/tetratricopeptide (TPR) repeat protein
MIRARTEVQAAREKAELEAEKTLRDARKARHALPEGDEDDRRLARAVEMEAAKWNDKIVELDKQRGEAEQQRKDAVHQRDEQAAARKVAEELTRTAEQVRQAALDQRAEIARQLVKMHVAAGTRWMEGGDLSASLLWFAEALRLAQREKLPEETHRLRLAAVLAQCPRPVQVWAHENKVDVVRISPDGKRILTAGADGAAVIRDAATGKRVGEPLAHMAAVRQALFSPDGKRVLTATSDMTVHIWDLDTGMEQFPALQFMGPVVGLAFSPDGKYFLTVTDKPEMAMDAAKPELRVWNAATGEAVGEQALGSDISPRPASFSPDSKRVLAICQDRCARIWDVTTEKQVGAAFSHAATVVQASFSPDGERVLTASADGTARVWQANTGESVSPPLKHGAALRTACFDPDGRYVLTVGEDRGVRVWDAKTGETLGQSLRHPDAVSRAVFSPDGRYVLTACEDGAARLWDYTTGEEVLPALHHGRPIAEAMFAPAGDSMLTLAGQVVRLWDLTTAEPSRPPMPRAKDELRVYSADGKRVLRVTATAVRVYDTATNQTVGGTLPHKNKVTAAAFSADNKRLLTISHQPNGDELEGYVHVWETATGRPIGEPLVHPRSLLEVSFSADGKRVLTACQDRKARLWDVEKSALVGEPMDHEEDLARALFVPDSGRILSVDVEGGMRLWNAADAEAVGPTWGHRKPVHHLAFSSDGKRLVTAGADGTATVWEANTGREIAATAGHGAAVFYAAFSPDDKRIVTVSDDRHARVWDAGSGKPVSPSLRHRAAVVIATFSADGRRLVTVAADGVRVWDAATGEPISPLLKHNKEQPAIRDVALGKDGRLVLSAGVRGDPSGRQVRDFRTDERPASDLLLVAEILSGQRLANASETASFDGAELEKAWRDVRKKHGKDFAPVAEHATAWHRRGAMECEQRQLWVGAVQHLDRLIAGEASTDLYVRRARANVALQRWEPAKADYTKALAGDAERWDLWAGRAAVEAALKHWEQAAADYSKAIERKADRAELWVGRGRAEAERGDWRKVAADLGKAIHLGEQDVSVWRQHALALLAGGDEEDYRRTCGRLVQHFGRSEDESAARAVAWTCALIDGAVRDWKPLVQRAERAVTAHPQSADDLRRLAVLLYRSGQFDAALKRLQEATRLPGQDAEPRDWLLMAMAAQRLGHDEDAKQWLAKADQLGREKAKGPADSWEERLVYQTLHREAETLVKGTKK